MGYGHRASSDSSGPWESVDKELIHQITVQHGLSMPQGENISIPITQMSRRRLREVSLLAQSHS